MPFCGNSNFWNSNYTLNSTWPRFTECFQSTALVYGPAVYLCLCSLAYIPYLIARASNRRVVNTSLNVAKTTGSLILVVITTGALVKEVLAPSSKSSTSSTSEESYDIDNIAHVVARALEIFTYVLVAVLLQLEKRASLMSSGVLFVYWLLTVTCHAIPMYTLFKVKIFQVDIFRLIFLMSRMCVVLAEFVMTCFSDVQYHSWNRYMSQDQCPEVTASFLSKVTFWWMTKLIVTGHKRPLVQTDLWHLNPRDACETAIGRFTWAWNRYNKYHCAGRQMRKRQATNKSKDVKSDNSSLSDENSVANGHAGSHIYTERTPLIRNQEYRNDTCHSSVNRTSRCSLFRVLVRGFGWEMFLSYICKFVSDCLQILGPLLLKSLILHVQNREENPAWHGYTLAAIMVAVSWLQTVLYHQHFHLAMTSGLRIKAALMSAIYRKGLCLDANGQRSFSSGEVVNLMSVDCHRVQDLMSYTWMIWSIPLQVCVTIYLLWNTIGLPVLAGQGLLLLLVPMNALIAYLQQQLLRQNLFWKDKRMKSMNETLGGIKVVKLFAWEESFQKKILSIRDRELHILTKLVWLNAISICLCTCAPYMVCLATFLTHVIAYPQTALTAEMAFVTLALFNILQFPISFIPEMLSFTTQARLSLKRIERYLCGAELDTSNNNIHDKSGFAVLIDRGVFTWDPNKSFRLSGITLNIPYGSLVAVVGPMGCGKSSLLSAILGEMNHLQGNVHISKNKAYVPQTAWVVGGTVQDNIVFNSSFKHKRYKKVIEACALLPDLEVLPGGDRTEIGEKGVNLSGGQKQRVNIARALYAKADLFLMDDPLSAVDSQVGKHIFHRVISNKGLLRNKTRILVTNALQWLPLVDYIVVMQEGRITEVGSYVQLMRRNGNLAQFLLANLKRFPESGSEKDEDIEVLEMKKKMWEHVELVTSQSEGGTSSEDIVNFHKSRLENLKQASQSEGGTSSEDIVNFHKTRLDKMHNEGEPGLSSQPVYTQGGDRSIHPTSVLPVEYADERDVARLTEDESIETGAVKLRVIGEYCRNVGYGFVILALLMFASYQVSNVLANIWLSKWTSDRLPVITNSTSSSSIVSHKYLFVYGGLGAAQVVFVFVFALVAALRMVSASSTMHAAMLDHVMRSPMIFFDTTPLGRILNRFSRDMEILDNQLPQTAFMWVSCVFSVAATLAVISISTPIFASVILPLFVIYMAVQRFFIPTSRQLKRLEAVMRSPIYSHFSESLRGCHVIRAFGAGSRFSQRSIDLIDKNQVFYFAEITANRWLGIWIEVVGSLIVFFSAVFSLASPGIDGATLGLSVSYALQVTQSLKWLVRSMSSMETNTVSVERVLEYSELVGEAPRYTNTRSPCGWPDEGQIVISKVTSRYRKELDPVLKGLECHIRPGEKVGIVGRTGAGKSSLTLLLFRLLEAEEGHVKVDNIDISVLGLYDLRSKITILPQESVIFSGTLRENLDPNLEYLDQEIWSALAMSHMKTTVASMPDGLYSEVGENGLNLSAGQRQLLCLARALLRRSKILILDEATSSVDLETEALVQTTLQKVFKNSTTIMIAHRIRTVLDCDRVMVLDSGSVVEFDNPLILLKQKESHFYKLAKSDQNL